MKALERLVDADTFGLGEFDQLGGGLGGLEPFASMCGEVMCDQRADVQLADNGPKPADVITIGVSESGNVN